MYILYATKEINSFLKMKWKPLFVTRRMQFKSETEVALAVKVEREREIEKETLTIMSKWKFMDSANIPCKYAQPKWPSMHG